MRTISPRIFLHQIDQSLIKICFRKAIHLHNIRTDRMVSRSKHATAVRATHLISKSTNKPYRCNACPVLLPLPHLVMFRLPLSPVSHLCPHPSNAANETIAQSNQLRRLDLFNSFSFCVTTYRRSDNFVDHLALLKFK